jgi:hypothetical protein
VASLFSCFARFSTDALTFQWAEEAFSNRVIVAVATPPQILLQVVCIEKALPIVADKLTALIGCV